MQGCPSTPLRRFGSDRHDGSSDGSSDTSRSRAPPLTATPTVGGAIPCNRSRGNNYKLAEVGRGVSTVNGTVEQTTTSNCPATPRQRDRDDGCYFKIGVRSLHQSFHSRYEETPAKGSAAPLPVGNGRIVRVRRETLGFPDSRPLSLAYRVGAYVLLRFHAAALAT